MQTIQSLQPVLISSDENEDEEANVQVIIYVKANNNCCYNQVWHRIRKEQDNEYFEGLKMDITKVSVIAFQELIFSECI